MAFSQNTLIQRVRDLLAEAGWDTTLSTTISSSATTTVVVPDGTLWSAGAIGEFQDDGEQFYVTSVAVNNLTVLRGYNGTTASASHLSGVVIRRDPFFSYKRVKDSIDLISQSLWPYIWKKVSVNITPVAGTVWYDLAADALAIIDVSQVDTTVTPARLYVYGAKGSRLPVGLRLNVPTTLAASGTAVMFPRGFATLNGTPLIQVSYGAKITATVVGGNYSDLSDGILAECVAHGAASRLMYLSELPRVTQQDVGMADSSVIPGSRTRAARDLWAQYIFLRNMYHEEIRRTMPLIGGGVHAMSSSYQITAGFIPPYP